MRSRKMLPASMKSVVDCFVIFGDYYIRFTIDGKKNLRLMNLPHRYRKYLQTASSLAQGRQQQN